MYIKSKSIHSRYRRTFTRFLTSMAVLAFFNGCAISTPFRGPGYDPGQGLRTLKSETVVVGLTAITLNDDDDAAGIFWQEMARMRKAMPGMPGLIGFSVRRQLFGNQGWTVSVWEDEASLDAFVRSPEHIRAMRLGTPALAKASFARVEVNGSEIPLSWDRIEQLLKEEARTGRYY